MCKYCLKTTAAEEIESVLEWIPLRAALLYVEDEAPMKDLPVLLHNVEIPAEQKVVTGQANFYIGIYAVQLWITLQLTHPPGFTFGKIERWWPIFGCEVRREVQAALDSPRDERYFEMWFRGVPSERGCSGRTGVCDREVRVTQISKVREGRISEYER